MHLNTPLVWFQVEHYVEFFSDTKSTPQLSVGSAPKLMPRKVYPKFKLLFNLTTTVQVHYAYTDLASCFVLS